MKALAYGLVLVGLVVPGIAQAQIKIDTNLVTCAQYLAMPPDQAANFAAWMSGWFKSKTGLRLDQPAGLRAKRRQRAGVLCGQPGRYSDGRTAARHAKARP